jgi:peroxiredoxin
VNTYNPADTYAMAELGVYRDVAHRLGIELVEQTVHSEEKVIRSYGILQHLVSEPSRLAARRPFFLIDQEGIVRERWVPEKQAELFPSEPIIERVREIAGKR